MEHPIAYIPMDRRFALAGGSSLADRTTGAALFVDISGFTQLTEALVRELGPQRGAEELTRYLNLVYDAVIDELHLYGGSVIAFAGDAITCWIDGDNGGRATACALAMQNAMQPFGAITTPAGSTVSLAMKAAVAIGPARRFLVGDPAARVIDALAGTTLVRLANAEHQAKRGEVVLDSPVLAVLGDRVEVQELRHDPEHDQTVGVVQRLRDPLPASAQPAPWPALDPATLPDDQVRTWLLPQVYERLRRGLGNFLAELRPTVALFVRFDGIDYDADAAAGDKLDRYIRWVQGIVAQYEGTLIDLNIGDKGSYLYINFGAPLAHEDNADRAAAAALALAAQPESLSYIGPVQIGISQGRMRAGAYGGTHHRTYGVLGDEVNMAARLMMAAQPGQILVSEAARRSISASFVLTGLPPIRVKGKSEPAVIFALTGVQQVRSAYLNAAYALPMIGRQAELAQVAAKLTQAAQGHGQVVGLVGEAGIGKTRLVAEIMRLPEIQPFVLYGGECESYGVNSSYLVWEPIWRGLLGIESSWPLARQLAVLQAQLRAIDPAFSARAPLLGPVFNLEIPDNDLTQSLDPKLRKTLLEGLLLDCLRAKARQHPLCLVFEACQWLDSLSYELLEAITLALVDLPICLICTYRLQEDETRARAARANTRAHYSEIPLAPLTPAEAAHLIELKVAQLLGQAATLPPTLVERLTQQAEGNPFYLEELLTYLHYRGVNFQASSALDQVELPDSLHRLMLSLLDQFSESQKITAKVASVIGRLFQAAWLYGVYPELGEPARVQADLEGLYHHEIMLPDPNEPELTYFFRQVLTQSVTYESLPHALKTILHEQIGRFIEQTYPDALDQHVDLLAYHYDRSANTDKRRHYLRRAGEVAQADFANTAALDYFTRLLPLLTDSEQGEVQLKVGQTFDTLGKYEEANSRFRTALALAEQTADRALQAQCLIALGEIRRKQSQYAEAASYFNQAQTLAEQIGDQAGVAKALVCAGTLALYQGDYANAQVAYTQSLALRRQLNDQPNIANVLNNLAITAASQGDFIQARTLFEESLAIRRHLQGKWGIANSLNNLGQLALDLQTYDEAAAYLLEAVTIQREIGDKWALGNALVNLGNAQRGLGHYAEAYPLYQESLQINRELGDRWMLASLLESIGGLLSLQGQALRALHLAGAANSLRATLKTPLSAAEQSQLDQALEPARQELGGAAAAAAWATGQALSLEQAITEALV